MIEARRHSQNKQEAEIVQPAVEASTGFIESPEDYPSHVKDVKEMVC